MDKASVEASGDAFCARRICRRKRRESLTASDLVILCNPFPILDRHLSIVHREHVEQKIDGNVEVMLSLAADLAPDYFVLYNGPSAAHPRPIICTFKLARESFCQSNRTSRSDEPAADRRIALSAKRLRENRFELFTLAGCGRSVIVFRGNNDDEIAQWIYRVLDELSRETGKSEPMVNIDLRLTISGVVDASICFRARATGPRVFLPKATSGLLVSPGAIDMAGVVVVPEHEHFVKIDGERWKPYSPKSATMSNV